MDRFMRIRRDSRFACRFTEPAHKTQAHGPMGTLWGGWVNRHAKGKPEGQEAAVRVTPPFTPAPRVLVLKRQMESRMDANGHAFPVKCGNM